MKREYTYTDDPATLTPEEHDTNEFLEWVNEMVFQSAYENFYEQEADTRDYLRYVH